MIGRKKFENPSQTLRQYNETKEQHYQSSPFKTIKLELNCNDLDPPIRQNAEHETKRLIKKGSTRKTEPKKKNSTRINSGRGEIQELTRRTERGGDALKERDGDEEREMLLVCLLYTSDAADE